MSFTLINKTTDGWITFEEIKNGDCFQSKSGSIFRKKDKYRALSISSTFGLDEFDHDVKVKPVQVTVTVR